MKEFIQKKCVSRNINCAIHQANENLTWGNGISLFIRFFLFLVKATTFNGVPMHQDFREIAQQGQNRVVLVPNSMQKYYGAVFIPWSMDHKQFVRWYILPLKLMIELAYHTGYSNHLE